MSAGDDWRRTFRPDIPDSNPADSNMYAVMARKPSG